MRMMNELHFPGCTGADLLPPSLLPQMDQLNEQVRGITLTTFPCIGS